MIYSSHSRQIRKNFTTPNSKAVLLLYQTVGKPISTSTIYTHETVNYSQEFVNDEGAHSNEIEEHWRQLKASLPTHGRRKHHYLSYLGEFIWRYNHRGDDLFWTFLEDVKYLYPFEN